MKILFVYNALAIFGGIERILIDKMNYLSETDNWDVYIITTDQGSHPIPYNMNSKIQHYDLNIRFHTQYSLPFYKKIFEKIRLNRLFRERLADKIELVKPDVIICTSRIFVSETIKVKGNIPLIIEAHNSLKCLIKGETNYFKKLKFIYYLCIIKKVNLIISLTHGDSEYWKLFNKNTLVIPNILHNKTRDKSAKLNNKEVIFVGRFHHTKGIDDLIKIWELVNLIHKDWHLSLYGEGELKGKIESIIDKKHNNLNISINNPTDHIFEKYSESSIFVITSREETFGLVIIEAMSCGLPVVGFDCPYGPGEIIQNEYNGYLIKNRNKKAFAEKLCMLIEDIELRKKMGNNAIKTSSLYLKENIMPQYEKAILSVINN